MSKKLTICILLTFTLQVSSFDKQQISFQKLPITDALPNATVKRIFQDSRGYIWLGTESGICRYDGYKLKVIKSNIDYPNLLSSGNILCMAEDKQGRLWFGTDRGVNVLNHHDQVIPLITDNKIQNLRINSILCDSKGKVWIGSENGLFVYSDSTKTIETYYKTNQSGSLPGNNINYLMEDCHGTIWVAVWEGGLSTFNPQQNTFTKLPALGKTNNPFVMLMDRDNQLWIGAWQEGIFKVRYDKQLNTHRYEQYLLDSSKPVDFQNSVYSLIHDTISDHIWALTPRGLSIISDRNKVEIEQINTLDLFNDASNFLHQIVKDRQGNIWIGTSNDGVYLANLNRPLFYSNTLDELKKKHGFINVNAFFEYEDELWLGLANYGIHVIDKNTGKAKNDAAIQQLIAQNKSLNSGTIRSIVADKADNTIWIGAINNLLKIKRQGKNLTINTIIEGFADLPSIKANNISALFSDGKSRMWIATRQGIILQEDKKVRIISSLFNNANTIIEEKPGIYWIGSPSKGILKVVENGDNKVEITEYNVANKKIISDEINAIAIDPSGTIWVGTTNGGLNRYNREKDSFESQNKQYAILEEDIKSIIANEDQVLWVSSGNKIIKIDLKTNTSILFSSNDNIRTGNFRSGAFMQGSDGRLYFGGGNGFCWFYPEIQKRTTSLNRITITDIEIHNKSIFTVNGFDSTLFDATTNTLRLNYKQRTIGLEFSALNFISPTNVNYAYRLKGVDKDWVFVDSKRRYVNYNNLSKGRYSFEVKSTDENGVWMEDVQTLNIIVAPAPYETWWAYLLYLLILAAISVIIYRAVLNRIRLRRDLLITRIKQEKTEELTQVKLKYFTNVSHELLTPLTIIACLIDDFNYQFPDNFKQYSIMKSNIVRLKRLLQQILDFRKMESGNMKLSIREADLVEFTRNICTHNFDPLVKRKNIAFSILAPEKLVGWFDADKIDKILFNLLSNAFKYTPRGGTINLTIQEERKDNLQFAKIFVNDTGSGIEPDRLPHIFDRFYGNNQHGDSNGIGLSLTKDLVEIHKGLINVESQVNIGTTFVVELPIDKEYFDSIDFTQKAQPSSEQINIDELKGDEQAINTTSTPVKNSAITLLVVEDNVDLLMIIASTLSRYYNVITAENGLKALEKLHENEVDIIVSDVMMPDMDGLTFCRTIKNDVDHSHTPVLLLTAKNQVEDRIACYNAGADAYIAKPFEMDVLLARLNSLILNRQKRNSEFRSSLTINPGNYESNSIDANFLKDAIRIVEENLSNFEFTHDDLFEALNTSKSTLYRKIKSLTGFSPSEFIRNIRLKHACLMLKSGTGNISEVAYDVGFNDPKYFSTCFKNEFGMTPREYIRENKPEETTKEDE
jgi:ligand-binding sensor domain-containing protein/signal transduction histidine kinase/DNA-binding response OmpR family regulator